MTTLDPPEIPEGAKAVVRAYPHDGTFVYGCAFTYDLWLVDSQRWTGPLNLTDAHAALIHEGYRPGRARQLIYQARQKVSRAAACAGQVTA